MDNMNSILASIKQMVGGEVNGDTFDLDLITHINMVFMELMQLGVGPAKGFYIEDDTDLWTDFMDYGPALNAVKTLMYLKVKLVFDPPPSPTTVQSFEREIARLEWRLGAQCDTGKEENQNG